MPSASSGRATAYAPALSGDPRQFGDHQRRFGAAINHRGNQGSIRGNQPRFRSVHGRSVRRTHLRLGTASRARRWSRRNTPVPPTPRAEGGRGAVASGGGGAAARWKATAAATTTTACRHGRGGGHGRGGHGRDRGYGRRCRRRHPPLAAAAARERNHRRARGPWSNWGGLGWRSVGTGRRPPPARESGDQGAIRVTIR